MPTHRDIAPTETDPQAPITAALMKALDENLDACMEGSVGAPRLDLGAVSRLTAGDVIKSRNDAVVAVAIGSTVTAHSFAFLQAGSVRCTFEHSGASSTARVERVRNGTSTVLASFNNAGGYVARSVDAPVEPGDELRFVIQATAVAASNMRFARIQTTGGNLWPGSAQRIEGNTYA